MVIIETKKNQYAMLFQNKNEFQIEAIKIIIEEGNRIVVYCGLIEDMNEDYKQKLKLFFNTNRKIKPSDTNDKWKELLEGNNNPKYIIIYRINIGRKLSEEKKKEQRLYLLEWRKKIKNGKK